MTKNPFHSLLNHCKTLNHLKQIHCNLLKTAVAGDPFVAGKLLLHSTTLSLPNYALSLFNHTTNSDVFTHNTLIRCLTESNQPEKSISIYVSMRRKMGFGSNSGSGFCSSPDSFSFTFVIKAAACLRSLRDGIQLHCDALKFGFDTHLFVSTTLISFYGECGCLGSSRKVFNEMPERNAVAWNSIITACFRCGEVGSARELFGLMPDRDLTSWNVMIAGFLKSGELELGSELFDVMPVKDSVSWSTLIVGFAHEGCFLEALGLFRELRREGVRTNEASLTGVLSACAQAGAFNFAKMVHGFVEKSGLSWIVPLNNALVDTYAKCGNIDMARMVFAQMQEKLSVVSWSSMMAGLAMHGLGEEAIELFNRMEKHGVNPDGVTFVLLLYACSHAGLVEQGRAYFDKMKEVYNLEPDIEHYGCMVDLYSRAGLLHKAYDFIHEMPVSSNDIIWRTLLSACSIHGNVCLAEKVKEKLSVINLDNSGDHVLLSNAYAVAKKWKDVVTVRKSMAQQHIQKSPGWSSIEVHKIMYTFTAGTTQSEVQTEAYIKLKEIVTQIQVELGYVPEVGCVLHDIDEEEKEDSISTHSEKLAVAFGIGRIGGGKMLRIVKNLRICRDCHEFMKMVSKVYKLEIVVRDRSRFHTFCDGSCSCRDYW